MDTITGKAVTFARAESWVKSSHPSRRGLIRIQMNDPIVHYYNTVTVGAVPMERGSGRRCRPGSGRSPGTATVPSARTPSALANGPKKNPPKKRTMDTEIELQVCVGRQRAPHLHDELHGAFDPHMPRQARRPDHGRHSARSRACHPHSCP